MVVEDGGNGNMITITVKLPGNLKEIKVKVRTFTQIKTRQTI